MTPTLNGNIRGLNMHSDFHLDLIAKIIVPLITISVTVTK